MHILRRPSVSGSIGALLGLLAGVLIGRASIPRPEAADVASLSPKKEARTGGNAPPDTSDDDAPVEPTLAYRLHMGRRLPKSAKGFEVTQISERPVAALKQKTSSVRFDMERGEDEYALSVIAFVEGDKKVIVHPQLDERKLTDISLDPGWGIYWSKVPKETITGLSHELTFGIDEVPEKATIGIDSIALAPMEAQASFALGPEAVGKLVDGFSKPSGTSVWSEGKRSVLGVVLTPKPATQYRVSVRANALSRIAPLTVSARVNGMAVGSAVFEKKAATSTWSVPASALHTGVNEVELDYPQTASPAEYNAESKDKRSLALRLYSVNIEPAQ
jgi:hypothetical protein